eukprot:553586_1
MSRVVGPIADADKTLLQFPGYIWRTFRVGGAYIDASELKPVAVPADSTDKIHNNIIIYQHAMEKYLCAEYQLGLWSTLVSKLGRKKKRHDAIEKVKEFQYNLAINTLATIVKDMKFLQKHLKKKLDPDGKKMKTWKKEIMSAWFITVPESVSWFLEGTEDDRVEQMMWPKDHDRSKTSKNADEKYIGKIGIPKGIGRAKLVAKEGRTMGLSRMTDKTMVEMVKPKDRTAKLLDVQAKMEYGNRLADDRFVSEQGYIGGNGYNHYIDYNDNAKGFMIDGYNDQVYQMEYLLILLSISLVIVLCCCFNLKYSFSFCV